MTAILYHFTPPKDPVTRVVVTGHMIDVIFRKYLALAQV